MTKYICRILATMLIVVAVYQVFTLGYGCSSEIEYQTDKAVANHKHYADEHLSVIYERKIGSHTDFVHLQVDTTYHEIGKGAYRYEVLCKREYNLRSFDNEYNDMQDVVVACFISGKEWEQENDIQCGYGRGSVSGSLIAYALGITQMDSLKFDFR